MALLHKSMKGVRDLFMGQLLTYGSAFVRLAILARILDSEDLGVAVTFSMTIIMLDMISNVSLNRLIVQSKAGDRASFLEMLHLIEACRGLFGALALFFLAWPISHFFRIPDARWAFHLLAIVPLLRGLVNLDIYRFERKMDFRPRITADVVPQVLITIAAWPIAAWLRDYSALLWLLLVKALLTLVASHLLAGRRYRWSWDSSLRVEIQRFGLPLLVNGLLLYLITQGDRFIVGNQYGMSHLAVYTVSASLALAPGEVVRHITRSIMLPLLSRHLEVPRRFRQIYLRCRESLTVLSGLISGLLVIMGGALLVGIFGDRYAAGVPLILPLAIAGGLWIVRAAPTTAVMATGSTARVMTATIVRSLGLGLAALAAIAGLPLVWLAWSAVVGELLALVAADRMLARYPNGAVTGKYLWAGLVWVLVLVTCLWLRPTSAEPGDLGRVLSGGLFVILWLAASFALFDHLRGDALRALQSLTQGRPVTSCGQAMTQEEAED